MTNQDNSKLRIFISCLAAYNAGFIHGKWVTALNSPDKIYDIIKKEILATSPQHSTEWAIHDYEGFGGLNITDESIEEICEMAQIISEWSELGIEIIQYCGSAYEAKQMLEDRYLGKFKSLEEYAQAFVKSKGHLDGIPDYISKHLDYRSLAQNLEYNGDVVIFEIGEYECHVFNNY